MAISRRRYITVENSFFERQPRIARHPTADRNEDEKPRNLGFNPPPPPPPLSYGYVWCTPTGYVSQFAWANLSRNSYPSFPSLEPLLSHPLSYLSRIIFVSFSSVQESRANYFWIQALSFFSPPIYCIPPSDSDETFQGYARSWQFLSSVFCLYSFSGKSRCGLDLVLNLVFKDWVKF